MKSRLPERQNVERVPMTSVQRLPWKTEKRVDIFKIRVFSFLLALASAAEVNGQTEDTNGAFEFWSRMDIRWITKKSIQHDFEFQYRNQQRVASLQERFQLYTFRWYILKRWDRFYIQSSPVTFFERLTNEGYLVNEYRVTQNAGLFLLEDKLQLRTGLEGRFFWSEGNEIQEIRWRTRLLYSILIDDKLRVQLSDELFFHERVSGMEAPFFDQNRTSLGVNYKLSKNWTIDSGYQFQVRSFAQDHIDNFNVFYFYLTYQI
jgi:hypothetical protein